MKISKLYLKNIYGIKEMALKPGDITLIEGSNEVGKTSILDAIKTLFTNQGIRSRVIHNGETEAELLAELDEGVKVDRKIRSEKSDYIKVSQGRDTIGSPEGYLKSLFSGTQFNPIKDFIDLGAKGQKKVLLSLCNIDFKEEDYINNFGEVPQDYDPDRHVLENLEAIQAKSGYYYLEREKLNRERRAKENVRDEILEALPKGYDPEEWRNVSLSELFKKVTDAQTNNEDIAKINAYIDGIDAKRQAVNDRYDIQIKEADEYQAFRIKKAEDDISTQKKEIHETIQCHENKISELQETIRKLQNAIQTEETKLSGLDSTRALVIDKIKAETVAKVEGINETRKVELKTIDERVEQANTYLADHELKEIEPLQTAAQEAETMKNYLRESDRAESINGEILTLKDKSDELTRKIELARALPGQLLQKAEMPVPGIAIENGELVIDGLPLDCLSDGRQMEIALEVAKAKAGELKVILIDGFEKLSKQRRDSFIQKAKDTGLQYFITRVTDDESLNVIEL